ncbi:unnamed protein product [Musa banksii]
MFSTKNRTSKVQWNIQICRHRKIKQNPSINCRTSPVIATETCESTKESFSNLLNAHLNQKSSSNLFNLLISIQMHRPLSTKHNLPEFFEPYKHVHTGKEQNRTKTCKHHGQ